MYLSTGPPVSPFDNWVKEEREDPQNRFSLPRVRGLNINGLGIYEKGEFRQQGKHLNTRSTKGTAVLQNVVRTLLINGYLIDSFERPAAGASLMRLRKRDLLGAEAKIILLCTETLSRALTDRLVSEGNRHDSSPVVIFLNAPVILPNGIKQYSLPEFFDLLGGEIRTDRIFASELHRVMDELGHNKLPTGFTGKPDDLLEAYSAECLQFLLECPVRRFGQQRRFEPLPDGLALGRNGLNICFDSKAYGAEFHPQADDIRRFASYVKDFNQRYRSYIGPVSSFVVISGSFSTDRAAIKEKCNDLIAECATPLIFMKASDLAEAVKMLRPFSQPRGAINWRKVLVPELFSSKRLQAELLRIKKDSLVR